MNRFPGERSKGRIVGGTAHGSQEVLTPCTGCAPGLQEAPDCARKDLSPTDSPSVVTGSLCWLRAQTTR